MTGPKLPADLSPFLQVYGNSYKDKFYILALRFKRDIYYYNGMTIRNPKLKFPESSIVVLRGKVPEKLHVPSCLVYLVYGLKKGTLSVPHHDTETLLRALVDNMQASYYQSSVLYIVTTHNPFQRFYLQCPANDPAFEALGSLILAPKDRFSIADASLIRHFQHSAASSLAKFSSWIDFASHLCWGLTPRQGQHFYDIIHRLIPPPPTLKIPSDFYQCEILYTTEKPVGILCSVVDDMVVEYISPMVVSEMKLPFKDVIHIECNTWLPLYKDYVTWMTFGYYYYTTTPASFVKYTRLLPNIFKWLQIQTIEKYQWLYADMTVIKTILFGPE